MRCLNSGRTPEELRPSLNSPNRGTVPIGNCPWCEEEVGFKEGRMIEHDELPYVRRGSDG